MSASNVFFLVNLIGGIAVLGGYAYYLAVNPEHRAFLWGGVPGEWKPYIVVSMFVAAAGYLWFFAYIVFSSGDSITPLRGLFDMKIIIGLVALFLLMASLWIPLTMNMIVSHDETRWFSVQFVLWGAAIAAILITVCVITSTNVENPVQHWFAVAGIGYLTFHCTVLDAILWVSKFSLP